jgi:DNA invertase Pin-like site-specific DNA recombinase
LLRRLQLDKIEGNGVRTVIVEDASRFARDLMVQELGILLLIKRDVAVYACNGENLTETDDPMKRAMRQMAGVFAELEKHRLVSKLKSGRDRKRATGVTVEGRKIANVLADAGHANERGQPFNAKSIQAMIDGPQPRKGAKQ